MATMVPAIPQWGGILSAKAAPAPRAAGADKSENSANLPQIERIGRYDELDVTLDRATSTFWCMMHPRRPCFGSGLLRELGEMQQSIRRLFIGHDPVHPPVRYFVVGSDVPGVFNLGGDLPLFAELIRRGERERLREYARACINVVYNNSVGYDLPIVTIAMVQGNALGGGFEAALSCDVIIAERNARFGLPEVLFNLFPGMGAYSFLSRRIGPHLAEKIITSGEIFEAEYLHGLGVIDELVENGAAASAVKTYVARHRRRHNAEQSLFRVRRMVNPVTYDELSDVVELWVDAALRLSEADLRRMERISTAQDRRWMADDLRSLAAS